MRKYFAETIGTLVLVFFGVGSAVLAGKSIGNMGVGLCFGAAVIAMVYAFGSVSGAHLNPAVSAGFWTSGKLSTKDLMYYIIAQIIGAFIGALFIYLIATGKRTYSLSFNGLGQNGWGGNIGNYSLYAAIAFEFIATFMFVRIILEVVGSGTKAAGAIIGLTLAVLLMIGMDVTNGSLNPARSLAPAIIVGGTALKQVWMFLVVPTAAGLLAGLVHRKFGFNK